jgi:hypothetical protein
VRILRESEIETTLCPGTKNLCCGGSTCACFNWAEDESEVTYCGFGDDDLIYFWSRTSAELTAEYWEPPSEIDGFTFRGKMVETAGDWYLKWLPLPRYYLVAEYSRLVEDRRWYCGLGR